MICFHQISEHVYLGLPQMSRIDSPVHVCEAINILKYFPNNTSVSKLWAESHWLTRILGYPQAKEYYGVLTSPISSAELMSIVCIKFTLYQEMANLKA